VDDKAAVRDGGIVVCVHGAELVVEDGLVRVRSDLAVLTREVTNLAGLRKRAVAGNVLAAKGWVEVGERLGAVAILRDYMLMYMEHCGSVSKFALFVLRITVALTERATLLGQVGEEHAVLDTNAAGAGLDDDGSLDVALQRYVLEEGVIRERTGGLLADWVVGDDSSVAKRLHAGLALPFWGLERIITYPRGQILREGKVCPEGHNRKNRGDAHGVGGIRKLVWTKLQLGSMVDSGNVRDDGRKATRECLLLLGGSIYEGHGGSRLLATD
jgi:hypothetical protein